MEHNIPYILPMAKRQNTLVFPNIHHYYIQNTYGKAPSKIVFYYPTPPTHLLLLAT
jgi:hypothetical protein